jgi:DNA-binding NarL/FixJ family response regulator
MRHALAADGLQVCGEAASADAVLQMVAARRPSVCLIGTGLAGGSVRAARDVVRTAPWTAVVLLSGPAIAADLVASLRDGVAGCLPADIEPQRLGPALRAAAAGEAVVPRRLVARLVDELRADDKRRIAVAGGERQATVTSREWRVIELLAHGRSTSQVASRLGVSPVTVRRHVSSVMGKLGVSDRESVFRLAGGRR